MPDQSIPDSDEFRSLTAKQHAVLALLADGRTSKEMAVRLGVSETAINRRVEIVRNRLGGITRLELARRYRDWQVASGVAGDGGLSNVAGSNMAAGGEAAASTPPVIPALTSAVAEAWTGGPSRVEPLAEPCVETGIQTLHLETDAFSPQGSGQDNTGGELVFRDSIDIAIAPPWSRNAEPRVVPGMLDGENAAFIRGAAIVIILIGILATIVLGLAAAQAITVVVSD